ncbi:hypothetical protein [Natronobacterium gregoryi]|uniref:Uncharacterized protein n=2 Tax=Natronobacterium gregoryi TaxID=44930 RepID=L0AMH3_NATGS|nr:hypothetical protein [Natronobacterium gregoryi]AFZ74639.1 hypothetical protein Natgr_3521 [Natronobacterium gregoryi SP2]ELY72543.1 hypothetical protein C490_03103 [Natronobacterium gregoryi SP2]PLK19821.1 hypothetical protein CYV19_13010 [Natronobacterium gregoryi SP2]SFJ31050.1 hypothetical protein SAMN05443661_12158 [Natronobacterium gregoryi]
MKRIMMDTNYWIFLKHNPQRFKQLFDITSREDVQVYFGSGNFIDLVKADEQDLMSKIIVAIADKALPPTPVDGNEFYVSDSVLDIIPNHQYRRYVRRKTQGLGQVETLQRVFRDSTWSATEDYFDGMEQIRELYQEWGHDNLKGLAFEDYLKEEGEKYILHEHEVDIIEYVKKQIFLHRVSMMDPNETVKENDFADMLVCTQAILSDCNMLLIEAKWANLELVDAVTENIEMSESLDVYKGFDVFLQDLKD